MDINSEFARNRAEEYGFDLWGEFVIPPYFQKLELMKSEKPQIIEGGRGCGKTMLIRYLCHDTQFSKKRHNIPECDLKRIGIYWKMDVQFASLMLERGANADLWINAFVNMGVLILTREIINSLINISSSNSQWKQEIELIDLSELRDFDPEIPNNIYDFRRYVCQQYNKFQLWVSSWRIVQQPIFYPKHFLDIFINLIKSQISCLSNSFYSVYIDEYENLNSTQKKIVNTWVKQSQTPLIFNIAMKHNALDVTDTLGCEKIVDVHDYRKINIENLLEEQFDTFAAEIFLLRVHKHFFEVFSDKCYLYDSSSSNLSLRLQKNYKNDIRNKMEIIFPKYSAKEIAKKICSEKGQRIRHVIEEDFQKLNVSYLFQEYTRLDVPPEIELIMHALLNRNHVDVQELIRQIELYIASEPSAFKELIHNNLFGCILNFYGKLNRICPLYAGYDTFLAMSRGNIRHFLELCYTSLAQSDEWEESHMVSIEEQLGAVKEVSKNMLTEIKQLGTYGNVLYLVATRLGHIFEEYRKRDSQSEPEQNQFSIKGNISDKSSVILKELVKWSVVYERKLTKQKGNEFGLEYLFNPIYSAYFSISYRQIRRIEIKAKDFDMLCYGSDMEYKQFCNKLFSGTHKTAIDPQTTLFL